MPTQSIADAPQVSAPKRGRTARSVLPIDLLLLLLGMLLWAAVFLAGTLVDSSPYRAAFSSFEGGFLPSLGNFLFVTATYTHTNIGILCVLASLLGALGASVGLGPDGESHDDRDDSQPRSSAALRGFLVYLAMLAGVLMFGGAPETPTQTQYIRLAGITSLLGFAVSYRPAFFSTFLVRLTKAFEK